jgi:hypothetical protein
MLKVADQALGGEKELSLDSEAKISSVILKRRHDFQSN